MIKGSDDLKYWLGLSLVPGLGPRTFQTLYQQFGSARKIWESSRRELLDSGLAERVCDTLCGLREDSDLEGELAKAAELGISLVTWEDERYPKNLKEISSPPPLLYIRGELLPRDEISLAVVGTRKFSGYGKRVTTKIVEDLVLAGLTIVSGLAWGIDSFAHRAALQAGGRTVAVLGHGLDQVYPPENRDLAAEIACQGALVSEFPLGFPPVPGNFPARNRIISGLSLGTLVCEAPERSGALITAACALEQGRLVFALPGPIFSPRSLGTGRLIQSGAKLVMGADDVLSALNLELRVEQRKVRELLAETVEEEGLLGILRGEEVSLGTDEIIRRSGLPPAVVLSTLVKMRMRGAVEETSGGRWVVRL